jgi:hypothetical protein
VLVFGAAVGYTLLLVLGASVVGLWHVTALKETLYWFFGGGVVLVSSAITLGASDPQPFRKLAFRAVGLTIVFWYFVEVLADFYVLPLAIELLSYPW